MLSNINWEDIAKNLLEQERLTRQYNYPEPVSIIIIWKGNNYIGSIQKIVPGFSLRRLDNKLVYMTTEQTKYMVEHLPDIIEIS